MIKKGSREKAPSLKGRSCLSVEGQSSTDQKEVDGGRCTSKGRPFLHRDRKAWEPKDCVQGVVSALTGPGHHTQSRGGVGVETGKVKIGQQVLRKGCGCTCTLHCWC